MHKTFYASGFLYHSPSQQILLQQLTSDAETKFVMFRGKCRKGNDPQAVFQECVEEALGITLAAKSIHLVYDYILDKLGEQFVYYAEVSDSTPKTYSSKHKTEWCLLSKLAKRNMSEQTRHDIIIGERVIRSLMESVQMPQ